MKTTIFTKFTLLLSAFLFLTSFKTDKNTTIGSGYYYFYYEGNVSGSGLSATKWVYISDIAYGERPGDNLTVPSPKERQRFINRVKSQYSSQASASDKYYIEDRIEYGFKTDKEDLIEAKNEHLETLRENDYKVFNVKL